MNTNIYVQFYIYRAAGKADTPTRRPNVIASGVKSVTSLIQRKKAHLVVIAHDIEPIEVLNLC